MTRRSLLAFAAAVPVAAQEIHHGRNHPNPHHHRSAEEWARILESPDRDPWQKPDEVVAALDLHAGQTAADIGAGSGYFSVRLAKAVGPNGKVYAVDIQQDLIDHLTARAGEAGLTQMEPVLGTPDDPKLPAASVDLIFICDVAHHIENRQAYYAKLGRALRPGGRIAIVDFYKKELPVGPGVAMKISREEMIAELGQAGFALAAEHDFLPYQYFLTFTAKS
ncbi:MAG: methyltransferase domain-containing protein [Acidobacteria bacterium]|nr:methyltransferase domain-containing protein [Acidobacteriota bacterium]